MDNAGETCEGDRLCKSNEGTEMSRALLINGQVYRYVVILYYCIL